VIDTGETCEDGNTNNNDACVQCVAARCGDGFVQTGVEQCDDGNMNNADLCSNTCTYNLASFTVTTVANSPLTPTPGGTAIMWPFSQGDEDIVQMPIGFDFNYLGAAVTDVFVVSNGYIAFEQPTSANYSNTTIPNAASPNAYLAWWYDDLDFGRVFPGVTTSATTQLTGTAPNRVRVLTFENVGRYGFGADGTVITAEVRLYETTNVIEVHYGTVTQTTMTTSNYSATVGYETTMGLGGAHTIACGSTCNTTANWPTSTIYRYTP
jgi:cysteine-rich repeat protein